MLRNATTGPGRSGGHGSPPPRSARLLPLTLLTVSAVAVGEGLRLVVGSTTAVTSVAPGVYVCAVGVVLAAATVVGMLRPVTNTDPDDGATEATLEPDDELRQRRKVWRLLAMMVVYAVALPWVGFALTNGLFTVAYLWWIAGYPVIRSLVYGVIIDAALVAFFTQVGVLLPPGVFGL